MNKSFNKTREVFKIKNQLLKLSSKISDIDINIKKLEGGYYKTKISIHIPTRRKVVSVKVDPKLSQSLDKAHKAVVKQILKSTKIKPKRQTIRKLTIDQVA